LATTSVANPKSAPAPVQSAPVAAKSAPSAKQVDFGSVTVAPPPVAPPSAGVSQPGLTASPADFNEAADRQRAQQRPAGIVTPGAAQALTATGAGTATVATGPGGINGPTPGGVTGQDLGGGYMIKEEAKKTRSTVTRDAIDKLSPTANPYQAINLLPGVVQSSTDNTGLNGGNIRLRGFNSDHIGMTIEGAPVNDSGNYALFPQEYTDGGNIAQISIAQGSPELDSPHIGATGGVINLYMRDPSKERGALVETSLGSNNLKRVFARVDTGQIGAVRSFLSFSNYTKDNWAGAGGDNRQHIDFKTVWDISKGNTVRFAAIYNQAVNTFYANPTRAQFNDPTYTPGTLARLPATFFNTTSPIDQSAGNAFNYEKYRINPFKNLILSAPSNFTLTENLRFDTTPYFWYGFGSGGGVATMSETGMYTGNIRVTGVNYGGNATLNDKILYYNPSVTETYRPGITNKLTYTTGDHKIVAGHWFELANHRQTAPYVKLNADGSVDDPFAVSNHYTLPAGAVCTIATRAGSGSGQAAGTVVPCPTGDLQRRNTNTSTMTNMLFIGDTWKATNRLTIDAGAKYSVLNRKVENDIPDGNPATKTLDEQVLLPTIAASYKLTDEQKVYASLATTYRSAPNSALIGSYSNSTGAYTGPRELAPEKGKVLELGHRYQGKQFATAVSTFAGLYDDFHVSTSVLDPSSNTAATVTQTINVGRLMSYGINGELGLAPVNNFRPYISGEVIRMQMLDNAIEAGTTTAGVTDFIRTKGNQLPGAPKYSVGVGLDYDDGHVFSNIGFKYIGSQYATYANDEKMPAFARVDGAIGYRFDDFGYMKKPEIKLNLFNILNERQLTGVNGITNANTAGTLGVNGRTLATSAPTYYMGQGVSGVVTFKAGF
jgi:iron complex outermembrane recepter protein